MTIISISKRFRVVNEAGSGSEPGRFTFEVQTTDAAGNKKWDVCQSERGGMLTLPYLLVVELVRGLQRQRKALNEQDRAEKPTAPAPPMTIRRIGRQGSL